MRTVNIAELKAHLSAHIQLVRDGEEVLVCDRNKPVARIVPCELENLPERERQLIARGPLRLVDGPNLASAVAAIHPNHQPTPLRPREAT